MKQHIQENACGMAIIAIWAVICAAMIASTGDILKPINGCFWMCVITLLPYAMGRIDGLTEQWNRMSRASDNRRQESFH